jgi:colicin import membrane protein
LLALGVHGLFGLLLFFTIHLQHNTPSPYMAELWTGDLKDPAPEQAAPAPTPKPVPPPPAPPKIKTPPAPTPPPAPQADIQLKKAPAKPQPETREERRKRLKQEAQNEQHDEDILKAAAAAKKNEQSKAQAQAQAAREQSQKQASAQQSRLASFEDAIRTKIRGSTEVPLTVPAGLTLQVRISVLPDGSVVSSRVVTSSGNRAYDEAVLKGIERAQPLPLPTDPELRQKFRDITLWFTHEKQK